MGLKHLYVGLGLSSLKKSYMQRLRYHNPPFLNIRMPSIAMPFTISDKSKFGDRYSSRPSKGQSYFEEKTAFKIV